VARERFLSVDGLHESAIRALIDQYETVATDLDARVQARDEVTLHHEVIVLGTADGDARLAFIHQQLSVIKLQTQTHPACRGRIARDPGHNDSSVCIRARAFALDYTEVLSTRYINPSPRIREST